MRPAQKSNFQASGHLIHCLISTQAGAIASLKDEIAEQKQKYAVLAEQLKHLKNSDKQAAKHAEERLKFVQNSQEGEKSLLAQTRRESHDRHEKEKKAIDDRLVAEGRKVAAVEAERDALTSKVKEFEARLLVADERAATLNAKAEELAAKLKDALAADAQKFIDGGRRA